MFDHHLHALEAACCLGWKHEHHPFSYSSGWHTLLQPRSGDCFRMYFLNFWVLGWSCNLWSAMKCSVWQPDICYYTLLHITIYYYIDNYYVLLRSLFLQCWYIIFTHNYIAYYYVLLQNHYYVLLHDYYNNYMIITSLLHPFMFTIITLLLHHYCALLHCLLLLIITSLLNHYYIIIMCIILHHY